MDAQPPTIGIVADDLTSAADGAAPFIERGIAASLSMDGRLDLQGAPLVSIDTNSRIMSPGDAAAATLIAASALRACRWLYKTVDSTLRGHVREEIAAALRGSARRSVLFAPAFPAARRMTRSGLHYVDGVLVTESPFARDPVNRIFSARLDDFRPDCPVAWTSADAESQADLDDLVRAIDVPEETLFVGSPGMARALAARLGNLAAAVLPTIGSRGRALVVVGSANPVSRTQADNLEAAGNVTLLVSPEKRTGSPAGVLAHLTREANAALRDPSITALIATGGETTRAVLEACRAGPLRLLGELEPGFPFGVTNVHGRELHVAMKAGGFGDPGSLARAAARLSGGAERV